ncbi:hypothetical protein [Oerskovia flava]|uniref:hypothetical protein n=1 Tax=Oerskovia flava TaxID=2986422 RepID=UPI00224027D4|nr:hypothetical protein [Oerskovia sp. JB1-3-2]
MSQPHHPEPSPEPIAAPGPGPTHDLGFSAPYAVRDDAPPPAGPSPAVHFRQRPLPNVPASLRTARRLLITIGVVLALSVVLMVFVAVMVVVNRGADAAWILAGTVFVVLVNGALSAVFFWLAGPVGRGRVWACTTATWLMVGAIVFLVLGIFLEEGSGILLDLVLIVLAAVTLRTLRSQVSTSYYRGVAEHTAGRARS